MLGDLIPCRAGDLWIPVIELATGKILNWPTNIEASEHFLNWKVPTIKSSEWEQLDIDEESFTEIKFRRKEPVKFIKDGPLDITWECNVFNLDKFMNTPETDKLESELEQSSINLETRCDFLLKHSRKMEHQANEAISTLIEIRKLFAEDVSFGEMVEILFANPLMDAEKEISRLRNLIENKI